VRAVREGRVLMVDEADKAPVEVVGILKGKRSVPIGRRRRRSPPRDLCLPLAGLSVPVTRLSVPVTRLSVPVTRLSVPLTRLPVPLAGLSVPLAGSVHAMIYPYPNTIIRARNYYPYPRRPLAAAPLMHTLSGIICTLNTIIRTVSGIIRTLNTIIHALSGIIRTLNAIIRTLVGHAPPAAHCMRYSGRVQGLWRMAR
jgi:hypothetical protein